MRRKAEKSSPAPKEDSIRKMLIRLLWRFLPGKGKFMAQLPFAKRAYGERTCGKQRVCDLSSGRAYHTRRRRNPSHTARAVFLPDRRAFLFPPVHSLRKGRPNSRRLSGMETLLCSRIPCLPNTAKMPLSGANGSYPTPLICFCQKDWSATTALPL